MTSQERNTQEVILYMWTGDNVDTIVEIRRGVTYRFIINGVVIEESKSSKVSEWVKRVSTMDVREVQ